MRLSRHLLLSAIAVLAPDRADAYIDPGTVSMVIQGLFALVFGAATAWIVRPWQLFKSLFRKRKPGPPPGKADAATTDTAGDSSRER